MESVAATGESVQSLNSCSESEQSAAQVVVYKEINLTPSPRNGNIPPVENRFKPGNPGRLTAGALIRRAMDGLTESDLTSDELQAIYKNPQSKISRRIAAAMILDSLPRPDMADFEGVIRLGKRLDELRAEGIDTTVIEAYTVDPGEFGNKITLRLSRDASAARKELIEQTDGKATQRIDVQAQVSIAAVSLEVVGLPVGFVLPTADDPAALGDGQ